MKPKSAIVASVAKELKKKREKGDKSASSYEDFRYHDSGLYDDGHTDRGSSERDDSGYQDAGKYSDHCF